MIVGESYRNLTKRPSVVRHSLVSILYKSIAGYYRVADGPTLARYSFIKNASCVAEICRSVKSRPRKMKFIPIKARPGDDKGSVPASRILPHNGGKLFSLRVDPFSEGRLK